MKRRSAVLVFVAVSLVFSRASAQQELDFLSGLTEFHDLHQMLPKYLKARANKMLDERREQVASWRGADDVARRKSHVRKTILEAIGGLPERTPLNAKVVGVLDREDYKIEKLVFESQPNFFVTANLYLPKKGAGPYPAVLYPLGHERGGKSNPTWQRNLIGFARKGYAALTWDPIGQGERYQIYDADFERRKVIRSTTEHSILGVQCILAGDNAARYTIWDGIRALDYLLSRPEVDSTRIACTGNSGGGTHTAYLSALEDRIHVAMPSCYLTSWSQLLDTIGPQDAEQNLLPWIGAGLDHADFIHAFAPRPYLMLSAIRDFFSIRGSRSTFREAQNVYRKLDAGEKIQMFEADDRHGYSQPRRLAGYDWLSRWFKGVEDRQPEPEGLIASFEELQVTETGQVATSLGGETVFTLNQKRARQLDKGLPPFTNGSDAETFRAAIRERVQTVASVQIPTAEPAVRRYGEIERDGYHIRKFIYESEPGILIPSLLFIPDGSGRRPAIIYVHGRGKAFGAGAGREIEKLTKAGHVVLAVDLRGMGETYSLQDDNGSDFPRYFGQWDSTMTALLMGESLAGMRAYDILQGLNVLAAMPEVDIERVSAIGKEAGGVPLLYAAALDDRIGRLLLENVLVSYAAVVNQRLHQGIFEHAAWGVLKSFDLPDLAAALTPRPVWITDAVNPLGNKIPLEDVNDVYSEAGRVYRTSGAADSLRITRRNENDDSTTGAYLEWFQRIAGSG